MAEHTSTSIFFDSALTRADRSVLASLANDVTDNQPAQKGAVDHDSGIGSDEGSSSSDEDPLSMPSAERDALALKEARDPSSANFEPTLLLSIDDLSSRIPPLLNTLALQPYVRLARSIVRYDTDVVMLSHLVLYFTTSVPSAVYLLRHFSYTHAVLHFVMQMYYVGTYTLMQHQHIHQRGILARRFSVIDAVYPYILDPLMGHTWNTYYYHHVKHHHVEGNGPSDLSSTIRYQRDSLPDFLCYVGRFFFFVWLDLPLYFIRKGRPGMALRAAGSEFTTYAFYFLVSTIAGRKATFFVYILPFLMLRMGLMVGNWGQHAFVDRDEPDSDFRSSITVIDVASNRFCFNDGYHTSHHLNPLRHWRDHPISFLEQKHTYAREGALVFHNIDFLMITFRLMRKDYDHLAKCLVPMGSQINLSMEERAKFLRKSTQKFTEEEIASKFRKSQ